MERPAYSINTECPSRPKEENKNTGQQKQSNEEEDKSTEAII